jgi:glucose/arabinose dehydrogenase
MQSVRFSAPKLAASIGLGALLAATAAYELSAQQAAAPPPAWKQGQPSSMADSKLAPHASPMTVTAVEKIEVGKLKVPKGFKVDIWAHGMPGARMMARGDKGTLFIGTRAIGKVYAVTDKAGKREHKVIAEGLKQPNGIAFKNGALYVISIDQALRFDGIEDKLDAPQPTDVSQAINLPPSNHHNWKFAAVGPDNKLYMSIGVPCNICEIDTGKYGLIRRQNLDGSNIEIVARGVRNSIGFDWHPQTKELWFTDNGRDWAGDAGPEEELNRVAANAEGAFYGFPYCHANGIPDPDIKKPNPCAGVTMPAATLGPHAAALGMRFYTGNMFPADYKNAAFIARRGSWNRTKKFGYDVVLAKINGAKATITPFITGFLDTQTDAHWGRPVDVLQMPDGALLVSDEHNGAIYRVSYSGQLAEGKR